ncbi:glycosyltransferase family 2 protein [Xanthomarina gelatinilytica]|uniref:glycosyltransferase family 2 protein n=1 Tax=Xanthomarina gelatinilytica TaxID=1137281 RepID=UPI003AA9CA49
MIIDSLYIVILNYNSAHDTVELFNLLKAQGYGDLILVVDNHSKQLDRAVLTKHIPGDQLVFSKKNKGYAAGNKIGIQRALDDGSEFVLLLNPDIRLDVECIPLLHNAIKKDASIAAVGPRICYRDNPDKIYSDGGLVIKEKGMFTTHINTNASVHEVSNKAMNYNIDYVNGSVFLARTAVFTKIGFMREDFFLYFEETEWCLRAKAHGYLLATTPEATAYHTSSIKGRLYHYYMTRNRLLFAKLYPEYYAITKKVVWKTISKDFKKHSKNLTFPNANLLAKLQGYIVGRLKK